MGNRASLFTSTQKQSIFYSDLLPNLDVNENTGQLALAYNVDDILNSLTRVMLMRPWEREYDPTGIGCDDILFNNENDPAFAADLQNKIKTSLPQFEKRINVVAVNVTTLDITDVRVQSMNDIADPTFRIDVFFTVSNHAGTFQFNHILKRVR